MLLMFHFREKNIESFICTGTIPLIILQWVINIEQLLFEEFS